MLLNKTALANALNVDRHFVTAMCAHGFRLTLGGRTTLDDALTWLRDMGGNFKGIQRKSKAKRKPKRHPSTVA